MLGLLELPDTELHRASELSFGHLIRHEAPERIADGSDVRSGVWQIGPQVPDEVQPKRTTNAAGARRLPLIPAHSLLHAGCPALSWIQAELDSGRETPWSSARGSSAPGPPVAPSSGGYVGGFRFEQAYAYEPPILTDALDRVSAELELAQDGGREVDPAGS